MSFDTDNGMKISQLKKKQHTTNNQWNTRYIYLQWVTLDLELI